MTYIITLFVETEYVCNKAKDQMLGILNDIEIKNVLTSQIVGRLACTDGKHPYIVPVTYTYDGDYIYGQTSEGKKLDILRKNPEVCFEVDVMTDMRNWKSVVITGLFEELTNEEAKKARDILFNNIFELMTSTTVHTHEHAVTEETDDTGRVKNVMYRIKMKNVSGRFEK